MFITGFVVPWRNALTSALNGGSIKLYKGVMPTDMDTYEANDYSADLLCQVDNVGVHYQGMYQVLLSNATNTFTPTQTGTLTWFVITKATDGLPVIMSDAGLNTDVNVTLTVIAPLVTGVANSVDGMELMLSTINA